MLNIDNPTGLVLLLDNMTWGTLRHVHVSLLMLCMYRVLALKRAPDLRLQQQLVVARDDT
jgi:hypothetical protein